MDEETASNTRQSAQQLLKKAIEADSRQAVAGAAPGSVLKAGEFTASLCSLRVQQRVCCLVATSCGLSHHPAVFCIAKWAITADMCMQILICIATFVIRLAEQARLQDDGHLAQALGRADHRLPELLPHREGHRTKGFAAAAA
jgi:hypothetical protein